MCNLLYVLLYIYMMSRETLHMMCSVQLWHWDGSRELRSCSESQTVLDIWNTTLSKTNCQYS